MAKAQNFAGTAFEGSTRVRLTMPPDKEFALGGMDATSSSLEVADATARVDYSSFAAVLWNCSWE